MTNEDGTPRSHVQGTAQAASLTGNPYRYTGRRLDAQTGLYYYRARYYDPEQGRFLQTDPIGYEDQMNLYNYVHNDPLNGTDPTGKQAAPLQDVPPPPKPNPPTPANDNGVNVPNPSVLTPLGAMAAGVMASPDGGVGAEIDSAAQEMSWLNAAKDYADENGGSANRVTVQAQGTGLRQGQGTRPDTANGGNMASAAVTSQTPIPREVVHGQLVFTKMSLHPKDQKIMAPAFAKAHSKVNNMVGFTGVNQTRVPGQSLSQYRIDIEVVGAIRP